MRADQTGDQSNNLKEGDTGSKKVTPCLTLSPELPPLLFTINRLYPYAV